ncbi:regulator [Streptomyces sp. BH-SS-21]|uniref:Regulator n=1 Tax=Streptomyces liliiviolaceus TaxID=2823109 RepID=A0A940XTE9_9ACTN|nr:NB-ARC domain-containing protein [Streptomyces liliiviolaceus]MBQ0850277.1 regulator [Streptomyces liliiviolaceus]
MPDLLRTRQGKQQDGGMARMDWEEQTSFIGRSEELGLIGAVLRGSRLLTLTGTGGVGKTRLARRVVSCDEMAAEDNVAWADLSPLLNAQLLAATVAGALGLSDRTERMPAEAICAWVGSRRALLVMDSCEHLLDECRNLVGNLLTACPNLRILATSRSPLRVRAEAVVEIEPLSSVREAVALFADRAAVAGHPLKDGTDHQLAANLCERLERLPLALELAAAQLRSMSLAELCSGLPTVVDLPATAQRATPSRHAALRTTIGWSHELCTPLERLLWARLSFMPSAFDDTSAWQVASGGPLSPGRISRALVSLCDKSVITERQGTFRMLDAVREYGRMWLRELGEEQALAHRHAEHVLAQTRQAHHEWFGPAQRGWYRRIEFLHSDIRLAADHFLAADPAAALELIGHVTFFWVCSGYLHEARQYLEAAIALASGEKGSQAWVQGLWCLGLTQTLQGEHDTARETSANCRHAATAAFDTEGLGRAVYLDGLLHLLVGRPLAAADAVETFELHTGVSRPEPLTTATALCHLVHVFALTGSGRLDQARREALELRDICQALDEYWTRSYVEHHLALISLMEGRAQDGTRHARSALAAQEHIRDAFGIAMVMDVLALALADAGDGPAAVYAFGAAARFWETVGNPQRGTPEMASLRDECETRLVSSMGRERYERAVEQAAACDTANLVAWGAHGGPLPEK